MRSVWLLKCYDRASSATPISTNHTRRNTPPLRLTHRNCIGACVASDKAESLPERLKTIYFMQLARNHGVLRNISWPSPHNNSAATPWPARENRAVARQCARCVPGKPRQAACYTAATCHWNLTMLPPKALLDALSTHASRLFNGDAPLPRGEFEAQFKVLLQSAFSKLDLVSRDEFDSQMVVLARTRARLEALEAKVAEMEARSTPAEATPLSE